MRYLFDTEPLIALFNDEKGAGKVKFLLHEVDLGAAEGYISSVTLTELYSKYAKEGEEGANEVIDTVRGSKLRLVGIDEAIALRAGRYKLRSIPLADALIAASAFEQKAHLVAGPDGHFNGLGINIIRYR